MPPAASRPESVLVRAAGPLAVEAHLIRRVGELLALARADPRLCGLPVRIVVPSASLRAHVCERLTAAHGSLLGVQVETLFTVASKLAGEGTQRADAWIEVLVRRVARDQPMLREAFDEFEDGYRSVGATVRDLFDAGFEPALAEACLEALDGLRLPVDERRRVEACLRTASRCAEELASAGLDGRADILRRAREAFEVDPERALPTRALFVHGFSDATGRAAELLESLTHRLPTEFLLDLPRDPQPGSERADLGVAFCERLATRIAGVCSVQQEPEPEHVFAPPRLLRAPGAEAEAREVALRVRAALADGAAPERIGIVARDLGPHAVALRTQLTRLGVPFSGLAAVAPLDGPGRRVHALLELLEARAHCSTERWLDASLGLSGADGTPPAARLRLGVRVLGAARLGEFAGLDSARLRDVKLGVATGLGERDPRGGRPVARARLAKADLALAVEAARATAERLASWPEPAPIAVHLEQLTALCREDLGWGEADPAWQRVLQGLDELEAPGHLELAGWEAVLLIRRALVSTAACPLGGAGAGVQVLGVTEARGRTFEHLFVIGLNRDAFPRLGPEDPLLSDDVRGALATLLPDVPIKARSRYEERYLFAQLVAAAPNVTLSWQFAADDGKLRVVSPLVERLLGDLREDKLEAAPAVVPLDPDLALGDAPRTARESALLAGLRGGLGAGPGDKPDNADGDEHQRRLALALAEAGVEASEDVAAARRKVLAAFEAGPFEPERLAPWLGQLGAQAEQDLRADPASDDVYVTNLEAVARCPWRAALEKFLRLERLPDPLESLPAIEANAVGQVVHDALQRIAQAALEAAGGEPADLAAAVAREPVAVAWPDEQRLDGWLLELARKQAPGLRTAYPGFPRALAEYARPYVDRAGELLGWRGALAAGGPAATVLGVEVRGTAPITLPDGRTLDVQFKADLVEAGDERVVLTDYKTGKPITASSLASTRLPRGELLQSMTYAAGAEHAGAGEAVGRYLYLRPDSDADKAAVELSPWSAHAEPYAAALHAIVEGWSEGAFFPRLIDPVKDTEPDACQYCDVAQACLVGDSGARRAMLAHTAAGGGASPAMKRLWELSQAKVETKRGGRR